MFDQCIQESSGELRLKLHVRPGAKRNGITGVFGDAVKLELQTPPVDGKANAALLKYLAKLLKCSRASVNLVSGMTSRDKVVTIREISRSNLINILNDNLL